jgi:hypothetical protein
LKESGYEGVVKFVRNFDEATKEVGLFFASGILNGAYVPLERCEYIVAAPIGQFIYFNLEGRNLIEDSAGSIGEQQSPVHTTSVDHGTKQLKTLACQQMALIYDDEIPIRGDYRCSDVLAFREIDTHHNDRATWPNLIALCSLGFKFQKFLAVDNEWFYTRVNLCNFHSPHKQ